MDDARHDKMGAEGDGGGGEEVGYCIPLGIIVHTIDAKVCVRDMSGHKFVLAVVKKDKCKSAWPILVIPIFLQA